MNHRGNPGYHRAVSLHLARTLDEIGINKLTVKKMRNERLLREQLTNVYNRLTGYNATSYHFGSQTEGATTPGMKSDIDILLCYNDWNVIEDWVDWKQGKWNLIVLHEDTAPGYCRLQLLRSDVPMAAEYLLDEHFSYDNRGNVVIKNTLLHSITGILWPVRNGPAATCDGAHVYKDRDLVVALPCRTWPAQAAEFTRRRRRHGWPSQRLIEEATSHGAFLVPVGYKLSPTEPLEWRVSASLAERCLMFSLTIVHIKCYVVLKILVKTFIEPRVQKSISSYHCKTALLHCVETTEPDSWREENLLHCITRCLKILRNWVSDLFCPQFMIHRENLFAGKVTIHNRDMLLSILTEMIRSDGRALLQVKMDNLGHKLQTRLNTEPTSVQILDSLASIVLIGLFERDRQQHINETIKRHIVDTINDQQLPLIHSVYQNINSLNHNIGEIDKQERQALQIFIQLLSNWLGSLLASLSLSQNRRVPRQAIQLMSTAVDYDVASMLKLASVFYCSGKLRKAEAVLQTVEHHYCSNDMLIVCGCYFKPSDPPRGFLYTIFELKGKKTRAKLFAHCVRFSRHEIHCVPQAVRHEMHKSAGDDIQHRHHGMNTWMDMASIDCLPFIYYLQFLTYKQLGKPDIQRRYLHNLDRCVREDHDFRHLETAWNLLGHCLEDEQDTDGAMACYRESLKIMPRNNAANWHVLNLRYKCIRAGCLPK